MQKTKKYYIISGLNLNDNNRGTAALSYGSFYFLEKFHKEQTKGLQACNTIIYKNPLKYVFKNCSKQDIVIRNKNHVIRNFYIWFIDFYIFKYIPIISSITKTSRILKRVKFIAAINGGDGFSDIYGTKTFENRLFHANLAISMNIPLIILPQTLGPFKKLSNYKTAKKILNYASKIYVRDNKFESELNNMNVDFKITKDLSFYMNPEICSTKMLHGSIGLNVSGLCYFNKFRDLSNRFDNYPTLITEIINHFQCKNVPVYLLAHSYNYYNPDYGNDDMLAIKDVYKNLNNKTDIYLIDKNLNSPQTKYVISQFAFFIGTRMHANFAAIFTKTAVYGLAYSYKYEGSFNYMGLADYYSSVLDIKKSDISSIIKKIDTKHQETIKHAKSIC